MSAPRIERGPMVAEVLERDYTRIGNRLIRDKRVEWPARSVFIWMASHKDGFGVSPESIAAAGPGGVSAAKSALRELEKYGYLIRRRERRANGTLGPSTYFITDMPEGAPEEQNRSSEPEVENPPVVQPPQVQPPVADHPHKKTIPLQEDQLVEDELSLPSLPAQRSEPDPAHEREISASIKPSTPQQLLRAANVVSVDEEEAFTAWVVTVHQPRSAAWWRTVAKNGDLPGIAAQWRATGGQQPLTGTDATVQGWLALADQLRPSTTDVRVQGALDLGRQMQAEHDATRRKPHQPYTDNVWDQMRHQLESGARPDGWESVPHCGHIDCDPITRGREADDGSGLKSLTWCSACHPNLQF